MPALDKKGLLKGKITAMFILLIMLEGFLVVKEFNSCQYIDDAPPQNNFIEQEKKNYNNIDMLNICKLDTKTLYKTFNGCLISSHWIPNTSLISPLDNPCIPLVMYAQVACSKVNGMPKYLISFPSP